MPRSIVHGQTVVLAYNRVRHERTLAQSTELSDALDELAELTGFDLPDNVDVLMDDHGVQQMDPETLRIIRGEG